MVLCYAMLYHAVSCYAMLHNNILRLCPAVLRGMLLTILPWLVMIFTCVLSKTLDSSTHDHKARSIHLSVVAYRHSKH